ncbi:ABC transporter ATP-binding protein [Desulfobacula sp.]|uniref:ABC transporter ATP-binding protein n=1 Tax=Desulfobacula sp. TaxID=2593537 RepID=UPI002632D297|nr:ABC transporter ATP-binding protein [Desulfobacula sp.]
MKNKMLSATGLCVDFFGLRALDNVSLTISKGEIVGLIGPNGSGKTTFVNALTGQVAVSAGQVTCNGQNITGLPPHKVAYHGIARSFQIVRLFDELTISENIELGAIAQGVSRKTAKDRANELMIKFDLQSYSDQLAHTLNYGDKRRVEISRALASQPNFLLLDEPAAGMNEAESDTLLEILNQLPQDYDLGILIIDHDMSLIMRLCTRLHVIDSGKTIGEGDVETVRRLPKVIEAYLGSSADSEEKDA